MDDIFDKFFGCVFRGIAYTLWELVFSTLFYHLGWFFLKIITIGKYPPIKDKFSFTPSKHSRDFVSTVGLAIFLLALIIYFVELQ